MSISKFKTLETSINNLIDWLDVKGIYGPIGYLEEALGAVESAKEDYEEYLHSEET